MSEPEPLSEEDIAELAQLFDLLARFDYEDKIREGEALDKQAYCVVYSSQVL